MPEQICRTVTRKFVPATHRRASQNLPMKGPLRKRQGKIPRVSRLMALAIHFDRLLSEGKADDMSALSKHGRITKARMTQIMNLLNLAPDIQEELLRLPEIHLSRGFLTERKLRPVSSTLDWHTQRELWAKLKSRL